MNEDPRIDSHGNASPDALTVGQSATGYWTVQRGGVQLAFAMTRAAAEHERETLERLSRCSERRSRRDQTAPA